jgi:exodeoxyribonuclease VII large subunit
MSTDWPFDAPAGEAAGANVLEYTVSELSQALRRTVEDTYGYVRVRGELGRVSRPGSGHVYLDLKDDKAVLAGVIWKGVAAGLRIKPEQGLEVIVTGKLTTFPGQSKYQIVIDAMEPAGLGALMALLEERRRKLAAEGLFDDARKQPIPYLPRVIGVVTSPTGAVIRDILHRLADRFPTRVLVWPARVQGDKCSTEVAAGIRGFNAFQPGGAIPRPDLIIVARGGGSLEDLWGFNEEEVVRAAAESAIPLIAAVGHETDWTLIDHAADARCPTPTAAAERAVPVRADLVSMVAELARRQARALWRIHEERKGALLAAARGLPRLADLLAMPRQRFDAVADRLPRALRACTQTARSRLTAAGARLSPGALRQQVARHRADVTKCAARMRPAFARAILQRRQALSSHTKLLASLSYRSVLARGFALVHGPDDVPVRCAADASPGLRVEVEFHDGRAPARFEGEGGAPAVKRAAAPKKAAGGGEQGSLL